MGAVKMPDAIDMLKLLEEHRWKGGLRIIVQGAMRMVSTGGNFDMEASWRADVFTEPRQRKASFTFVAETPQALLRDMASLCEEGEVKVNK